MSQQYQPRNGVLTNASKFILITLLAVPMASLAQTNMTIYADSLVNGWSDGSYNVTHSFANTSPVHSGSDGVVSEGGCSISRAGG